MMPLFSLDNVSYSHPGGFPAVSEATLTIAEGERFVLVGSNGSGKSTLFQLIGGLIFPDLGTIKFKGRLLDRAALKDKAFLREFRSRVGILFQDSDAQLFCPTVLDDLIYGPLQLGMPRADALRVADEIARMLQVDHLTDRSPLNLSGGEKKRVALATVLTMNPEVVLLDEPTAGLDPRSQHLLMEVILALNTRGVTTAISTHDLKLASLLEARVAVLGEDHRIAAVGPHDEILSDLDLLVAANLVYEEPHLHRGHASL